MKREMPPGVWFLLAGALLATGPLLAWLPRYTTSDPAYCLTCHGGTGNLPNRGVGSKVHPSFAQVTCVDCHAKRGMLIYEGYKSGFMSEPERVAPNCLHCHEEMTARNDQADFKFNTFHVKVPHKLHFDLGARCTDCHSNIVHDLRAVQTNRPRMEYCSQCHATTVETCTKCHGSGIPPGPVPAAGPAGLTGDGRGLYFRYCKRCHGDGGDQVARINLRSKDFLTSYSYPMLRTIVAEGHGGMPAFGTLKGGPLTEDEIRAILAHLKLSAEVAAATDGHALYESNCVVCHGAKGDKMPTVNLGSRDFIRGLGSEAVVKAIFEGKGGMPAFSIPRGGSLSYEEIFAIQRYILSAAGVRFDPHALYVENCAVCHGEDGKQVPNVNLGSGDFLSSLGDEALFEAVAQGKGSMLAFGQSSGGNLADGEIRLVLEYLKSKAGLVAAIPISPPSVPHGVEGMEACLLCHGEEGMKPVPADHTGRTEEICQSCHAVG